MSFDFCGLRPLAFESDLQSSLQLRHTFFLLLNHAGADALVPTCAKSSEGAQKTDIHRQRHLDNPTPIDESAKLIVRLEWRPKQASNLDSFVSAFLFYTGDFFPTA